MIQLFLGFNSRAETEAAAAAAESPDGDSKRRVYPSRAHVVLTCVTYTAPCVL